MDDCQGMDLKDAWVRHSLLCSNRHMFVAVVVAARANSHPDPHCCCSLVWHYSNLLKEQLMAMLPITMLQVGASCALAAAGQPGSTQAACWHVQTLTAFDNSLHSLNGWQPAVNCAGCSV